MFNLVMTDSNCSKWLVSAPDELHEELVSIEKDDKSCINWENFKPENSWYSFSGTTAYNIIFRGGNWIELKAY